MKLKPLRLDVEQRSAEWYVLRERGSARNPYPCALGASDIAALVLGQADKREYLWRKLSHLTSGAEEEARERDGAFPKARGTAAEEVIRDWYLADTRNVTQPAVFTAVDAPWLIASLDGLTFDGLIDAEFKLLGRERFAWFRRELAPPEYYVQVQAQLALSGAVVGHLFGMQWGTQYSADPIRIGLTIYPDDDTQDNLVTAAEEFCRGVRDGYRSWERVVVAGFRPGPVRAGMQPVTQPAGGDVGAALERRNGGPMVVDFSKDEPSRGQAEPAETTACEKDAIVTMHVLSPREADVTLAAGWIGEREEIVGQALKIVVTDPPSADAAGLMVQRLTGARKRIEEARLVYTRPLDAAKKTVMDRVAEFLRPIVDAEHVLAAQLDSYRERQRQKAAAEKRERMRLEQEAATAAAAARKTGNEEAARTVARNIMAAAPAPAPAVVPIAGQRSGRKPVFRIDDPDAIERAYCSPDEAKIRGRINDLWKALKPDEDAFLARAAEIKGVVTSVVFASGSR